MTGRIAAVAAAVLLLAASPAPSASPQRNVSITCEVANFYLWPSNTQRPRKTTNDIARLGERFSVVSGPRATLDNTQYYELDIPVTEVGGGEHYWVNRLCANEI